MHIWPARITDTLSSSRMLVTTVGRHMKGYTMNPNITTPRPPPPPTRRPHHRINKGYGLVIIRRQIFRTGCVCSSRLNVMGAKPGNGRSLAEESVSVSSEEQEEAYDGELLPRSMYAASSMAAWLEVRFEVSRGEVRDESWWVLRRSRRTSRRV